MNHSNEIDYEHWPANQPMDETDVSLRAYLSRLSDEHLARFDPAWSDDQVMEWDGNFKCDGTLMLVCCERDVGVTEFRRVLAEHLQVRTAVVSGPNFTSASRPGGNTDTTTQASMTVLLASMLTLVSCGGLAAQDSRPGFAVPADITFRAATIQSEGARMAAEVFAPREPKESKLPTIIMCHGWGGLAEQLRPDAIVFAQAGYLVVTFDYRGWGLSDSRVILAGSKPASKDHKWMAEVKEVRGVVDPIDQTTDLMNAIHWTMGDPQCDPRRVGLWGSSFSGGHVAYVAARDPRVKAFVSQVAAMDGRWVINNPQMRNQTFTQGTARARGQIEYPQAGEKFGTLKGAPVLERFIGYAPVEDLGRCQHVAKLFIIAEKEELFDSRDHAILAYQRATGVKNLVTLPGITHYGIRSQPGALHHGHAESV